MVFVDANIPMYVIGGEHPNKVLALELINQLASTREPLATNSEVFQEIMHRYLAINRREGIQLAFDYLENLVDRVFPVTLNTVKEAKSMLSSNPGIASRDAVHLATMSEHGIKRILSFDAGFDQIGGIQRVS